MIEQPPPGLTDDLSNPSTRDVLKDWYADRGASVTFAWIAAAGDADDADVADDADAAWIADADDDDGVDADVADAADADDADVAAADADAGGAWIADDDVVDAAAASDDTDSDAATWTHEGDPAGIGIGISIMEPIMEPGLYLLRLRGGWYGRGVTVVGWLMPHRGDWWWLRGARGIRRVNSDTTSLGRLADVGMTPNHRLTNPVDREMLHVMSSIMRAFPADPSKWEQHCPRPIDWKW